LRNEISKNSDTDIFISIQQLKISLFFYAPRIINLGGRTTNYNRLKSGTFLWYKTKCNKFEHFSFSR